MMHSRRARHENGKMLLCCRRYVSCLRRATAAGSQIGRHEVRSRHSPKRPICFVHPRTPCRDAAVRAPDADDSGVPPRRVVRRHSSSGELLLPMFHARTHAQPPVYRYNACLMIHIHNICKILFTEYDVLWGVRAAPPLYARRTLIADTHATLE